MMSTQCMELFTTTKTGSLVKWDLFRLFFLRAVAEEENSDYGADDEEQGKDADWTKDNNSNYSSD